MKTSIIVAVAEDNVIGKRNSLPWYLPADLKHFKKLTTGHHIIMGQKTFESIGKALPDRTSIVLSFDKELKIPGCIVAYSLEQALQIAKNNKETKAFIIGGGSVFQQSIDLVDRIYMTKIDAKIKGDIFFPEIKISDWKEISREEHSKDKENDYDYSFLILERKRRFRAQA